MLLQDELSRDIWERKYRHNGESEEEWFNRVSNGDKDIEKIMKEGKFLFAGRILSNRGLNKEGKKVTYSNCYVLSTEDSIEGIYKTHSDLARTFSYGGGVGVDITPLRPKDTKVNNAAETTSGPVSFMPSFSQVTEIIGQKGRRGALMLSMSCEHPDIEEFIDAKTNDDKITKANISIRVTDKFMDAVINKEMFTCKFELDTGEVITKEVDAYKLFRKLCENNWNWGEPGILFWDTIERFNLLQYDENFKYAGVNPCAEEPLPNGGSCLLGSINLSAYVGESGKFNLKEFTKDIPLIVKAMNDVLDEGLELHPLEVQRKAVSDYRQIGIGVMGIADMLIKMGVKYGSDESLEICNSIGLQLANSTLKESAKLAKEFGAYSKYSHKILESEFFKNHADKETKELVEVYGLRNSQLLTIAPTGSISNMLGISGGIEPIFANFYTRKTESLHDEEKYYKVFTPIVAKYMEENSIEDETLLPNYFVTAQTLDPIKRLKMQSVWQSHIDASISSTVNLPNETTVDDVENIYIEAWGRGLKGLTIFRDGCKRSGVLTTDSNTKEEVEVETQLNRGDIQNVDIENCISRGKKLVTGCGTLWMSAYFSRETGELQHIFLDKGSKGGCNSFMCGLSRLISIASRGGVGLDEIIDQLKSTVTCNSYYGRSLTKKDTSRGGSCPSAIGMALKDMAQELSLPTMGEEIRKPIKHTPKPQEVHRESAITVEDNKCPVCGAELIQSQGCVNCLCGYSKCDL